MTHRTKLAWGSAAICALVIAAAGHAAAAVDRSNYLSFNQPVALPGVTLPAGTYIFESVTQTSHTVVRVTSRDRRRVLFMGFTSRVARPAGWPADRVVSFGEAPAGRAQPIAVWYPIGSQIGHQFIYR